ncbi:MAG: cell division protein FtsA [Firmicutes bacterium]|nr:cell division protein FtsA [Bacillota bacterium]
MGATLLKGEGLVASFDLGTSKVVPTIAEVDTVGAAKIIGVGTGFHRGLHRGEIVDPEAVAKAVMEAAIRAERMAQVAMPPVVVGIPGCFCSSFTARGAAAIKRPGHRVQAADVERALDAAAAMAIPPGRRIIHRLIHTYLLDGQRIAESPIGLSGRRLEVDVHFITAPLSVLTELANCLGQAGVRVDGVAVQCLATARMVLAPSQRELGVVLVDLGAGQTDIVVFRNGQLDTMACLPVGTDNLARDLSAGLGIAREQAEQLVWGVGCPASLKAAPGVGSVEDSPTKDLLKNLQVEFQEYNRVFMARAEEIWQLVQSHISKEDSGGILSGGVRLVGGGALVPGMAALGAELLGMPVDVSLPEELRSLPEVCQSPAYAAAVALTAERAKTLIELQAGSTSKSASLNVLWQKVRSWLRY